MTRNSQNRNIAFNQKLGPQIKNILHCRKPAAVGYILTRIGTQSHSLRAQLALASGQAKAVTRPWTLARLGPAYLGLAWLGLKPEAGPCTSLHFTIMALIYLLYFSCCF